MQATAVQPDPHPQTRAARPADLAFRPVLADRHVRPRAHRPVCENPAMQGVAAGDGGRGCWGRALRLPPSSSRSSAGEPAGTRPSRSVESCTIGVLASQGRADHRQQPTVRRGRRCTSADHASPHPSRSADHTSGTADPGAAPSVAAPRPDPCTCRSAAAADQNPSVTARPYSRSAVYISTCNSVKVYANTSL